MSCSCGKRVAGGGNLTRAISDAATHVKDPRGLQHFAASVVQTVDAPDLERVGDRVVDTGCAPRRVGEPSANGALYTFCSEAKPTADGFACGRCAVLKVAQRAEGRRDLAREERA